MNRVAWLVVGLLFVIALAVLVRPTHLLPPGPTSIPPPSAAKGG
jgi:hypothetical protein